MLKIFFVIFCGPFCLFKKLSSSLSIFFFDLVVFESSLKTVFLTSKLLLFWEFFFGIVSSSPTDLHNSASLDQNLDLLEVFSWKTRPPKSQIWSFFPNLAPHWPHYTPYWGCSEHPMDPFFVAPMPVSNRVNRDSFQTLMKNSFFQIVKHWHHNIRSTLTLLS